jgi:hypothetical protein
VTYLKCSAFELTPGSAMDGGGGYVAVDGELVATARETSNAEVSDVSVRDASEPKSVSLLPGSPASWRVPYGPTRVRVRAGGARVFAAGGLNAADAA